MTSEHSQRIDWMTEGVEQGWVEAPVCSTHDTYLSEEEAEQFWDGEDPCIVVMRVVDVLSLIHI